jgi:hypothetical protein
MSCAEYRQRFCQFVLVPVVVLVLEKLAVLTGCVFSQRLEGSRFGEYPCHPHEFVSAYYKAEPVRATSGSPPGALRYKHTT